MRYKILFFLSILLLPCFVNAQGLFILDDSNTIVATKNPERTVGLILDAKIEQNITSKDVNSFNLKLPFFGTELQLQAEQFKVYAENFQIISLTENSEEYIQENPTIKSYKLSDNGKSIGVINFFNNEIIATFKFEDRQYEIAKHKESYILFEASNSINASNFSCAVDEEFSNNISPQIESTSSAVTSVCIELAIEVDNYTRNTFSSNLETTNWALAIIAGVNQIYDSEINTAVVVVYSYIWNTIDPYSAYIAQSSAMLTELKTYWTTNNGSISRDLVHLLTKRTNTGTGGIAYVDVLCDNSWGYGFSSYLDNDTIYSFPNPSYTWNLACIAHEVGHNIGSHHTHWCGWIADPFFSFPGGVIDNCVDVEGSCSNAPAPQIGTIMSYCDIVAGGSIVLGFHDIVVSQALDPGIANATCLTTCDYYGCTDSTAFNYNPNANVDDGSCIPKVFGCIDTAAANYNLLANTDDGSCTYCSVLSFNVTDISCNGFNDGAIDLTVQNGIAPFTYLWTSPNGFMAASQDISSLYGGLYSIVVTDGFGCSESLSVQIIDPNPITINGITTTNVSCYGLNDGTASVMVSGGFLPYTFDYGTANPNALSQGIYNVTVTDINNCPSATDSFVIIEPGELIINATPNNVSCNGFNDGNILVSVSGGSFPFSFSWSSPNGFSSSFQNINNLAPGNYNLYLVDASGCTAPYSVLISEPNLLNTNVNTTNVSCNNGTDGIINLSPSGGTQPYNFVWNNGSSLQNQVNVSVGNYFVSVSDNNGCSLPIINILLTQPPASVINSIITDVDCFGNATAAIDVSYFPSSAVNQFSYSWVGPNSYIASTEDILNIEAGLYILTVLENGICNKVVSYMVNEPAIISVIENVQNVSCFGGSDASVNLGVSGGIPIYSTDWLGQNSQALSIGSYLYTVTDQNSCVYTNTVIITQPSALMVSNSITAVSCNNGADAVATLFISGGISPYTSVWPNADPIQLNAGYHTFTTHDDNGCVFEDSVFIQQPSPLQITENTTDVLCYGGNTGTANLSLSGATAPYTVNWQGVNNNILSAGNYMYDVVDGNNCIISGVLFIAQPPAIAVQNTISSSTCLSSIDGSVVNVVSGGVPPYTQSWNGINPLALSVGIYNFTIIDANACIDSNQVVVSSVSDIGVVELVNDASCDGFCDGDVNLFISNGAPPYQVLWQNGAQADSLCEGVYTYQITDNLSCVFFDTVEVNQASPIILAISQQSNILTANTIGGTQPYYYAWWTANVVLGTTQGINISQSGNYYCVVYDANNCNSDTVSFYVNETGLENLNSNKINIYPNPSTDYFNIEFPYQFQTVIVELKDILGRTLITKQFKNIKQVQLNTASLAAASYYVVIKTDDFSIQKKIIIQ